MPVSIFVLFAVFLSATKRKPEFFNCCKFTEKIVSDFLDNLSNIKDYCENIICFYSDDPSIKGYPNLHRVVKPPIQVGDKYEYITKGDANAIEDSVTAKSDNLIGKYVKVMDGLTNLSEAMNSKGMLVFVMTLCVLSVGIIAAIVVIKSKDQTDSTDQTE